MKMTKEQKEQILRLYMEEGKSVAQISKIIKMDVWEVMAVTDAAYRRLVEREEAH
jgi:hypothetical protein